MIAEITSMSRRVHSLCRGKWNPTAQHLHTCCKATSAASYVYNWKETILLIFMWLDYFSGDYSSFNQNPKVYKEDPFRLLKQDYFTGWILFLLPNQQSQNSWKSQIFNLIHHMVPLCAAHITNRSYVAPRFLSVTEYAIWFGSFQNVSVSFLSFLKICGIPYRILWKFIDIFK